jgi:transposase
MKKLGGVSRRELFERLERPALRQLPNSAYEYAEWRERTVNVDYHVEVDKHWYSAPYRLVHQEVWARVTGQTVELLHLGERVASHRRSSLAYEHTTDPAHMPEAHRRHTAGPDGVLRWAESIGPMATAMVQRLLDANPVREQGWRSARGLQRVGEKYGAARTEQACASALRFGARSYKPIERLLALGREGVGLQEEDAEAANIQHENLRGPDYYH